MSLLKAQDLSFQVKERYLLQHVGFSVEPGEFLAVIGRNGAGKTTLLRLLTNDLTPKTGKIEIFGRPLAEFAQKDLATKRAVLAQSTPLNFAFEVLEVVLLGRIPHERTASSFEQDLEIAMAALAQVGLQGFERRNYLTLSGGEQQRVQLARTLCQIATDSPERLLFLDEPTSSLDVSHQHRVLETAKKICHEGAGVFAILHDINLAAQYADKVLILAGGRKVAFGPTADVLKADILSAAFQHNIMVTDHPRLNCKLIVTC
ncbi:MAG: heme ABC transporter ATP-binding protein [Bdellovibrionaceae bacterium]|nr:heme ABC transporter ATP-binding protein [Pseudobdellovibrionaceae bacterium]